MKFTLSWLKEHLDTGADAATIADKATNIGLEVEHVEDKAASLAAFTVARVISAVPHPNADKLRLCMVDTGRETAQVVCGAPNAREGLVGVFAPPGTYIPGSDFTLSIAKIRGVESRGMLCSERELLLSNEHDGIIELPPDTKIGSPAAAALGLTDPVIDVAITPNRGDCTSVYGIARDLAAARLGTLKSGAVTPVPGQFPSPIRISLEFPAGAETACPIFAGRLIRGVKNGPSPEWVQKRLKAIGLRPISALVDVTNLIAHDRGRPLHAFDAGKLKGHMRARLATPGETLLALDGKTYTLDSEMTVIADEATARGIAGVMGGEDTGCTEDTTQMFVESAYFDPIRTARTGRTLGIVSDARYRFERGVDPEFVIPGLELATQLILEFCGGEPSEIVVAGAVPQWKRAIPFSATEVKRLAGLDMPQTEIVAILTRLGFEISGQAALSVVPPSWRSDVHGPADLVEEVVRIHGLENVPAAPMSRPYAVARAVLTSAQRREGLARRALATCGFDECVHFSFIPRAHAALFGGGDEARQLENPISADLDAMRPSLLPSLLAAAARNQARGFSHAMLFEIGAQFESGVPEAQTDVAAGIRAGEPPRHWLKAASAPDIFTAKADCLAALEAAWGGPVTAPVQPGAAPWYHPGRSGTIALGPKVLAYFGELHPRIIAAFDLKGPVSGFEIFLDAIPEPKARPTKARAKLDASDLMAVERDFAFVVDAVITADQILKAARAADRQLIERVELFDIYEGKGVPEGKKSLAIAVTLQPKERTLTEAEIDAVAQKIVNAVTKATGGVLRS
ncbi:MAG TPA: phenylalanine--tRNA ligase subunit beta [Micropepsaceae bacterium]|nr:phenylalanine--tRNA ligase subunit beta [Micropepsaceae bacterium]